MKHYFCKHCFKKKKPFTGNRQMVRKHLREEHLVKEALADDTYSADMEDPSDIRIRVNPMDLKTPKRG